LNGVTAYLLFSGQPVPSGTFAVLAHLEALIIEGRVVSEQGEGTGLYRLA